MNTIPFAHAHTPSLVVVSVIIAILASYTALDLAGRVTAAKGAAQFNWLLGGATAMGLGIWSMHFTAMLAFQLPIPVAYDIPIVVLSLFVAIGASAIALYTSSRPTVSPLRLILSGLIMGGAIAAMHYIGMAAMRLEATLAYAPTSFILSILIAVTASLVALWLSIELRNDTASVWNWFKLASAGVMGVAISGMHYTGMHAAIFTPAEGLVVDMSRAIDISVLGAGSIAAGTFVILGFALLLSVLDQRLVYQTARLFEREEVHSHELETLNQNLERYVANLQLVAEVSRITSGILDQTQLVSEVVHQVQSTFNYYHAHLYLYDEDKKTLQVVGGTGEAGRAMLLSGHHIPVGKGLVGRAAATNEIVSVLDVTADPDWLPNILLPDTKAEIAVPIALGNEVLGVLDVQHSIAHGFQQEDAKLLQSIANQVAVALRNTRIFSEVETALAQAQNTQELYQEQSWQQNRSKEQKGVYHYQQPTAPELDQPILTEAKRLALSQNKPTVVSFDDGHNDTDKSNNGQSIIAPIKLRNRAIGALQLHADDQNWSESDLALIEAVMDQMGQTAETLRLFDETRQRASQEQTIREITEKLRAAPNLDALLEIAARELGQRLGVRHTVIELGIDQSEALPTNGTNGHGK